jgi:3-oxoacyl-[acyl-carrier protein] reductase
MDLGLADRVYVLTGASRGLGFATAECLVADGAKVLLSSRDKDRVAAAARALGGPERAVGVAADLADPMTPQLLVDTATERFGRLDGALISSGGPPHGGFAQVSDAQWRAAFETIFLGTVRTARTVAEALAGRGRAIGLVLSISARPAASYLTGLSVPVDGGGVRGL